MKYVYQYRHLDGNLKWIVSSDELRADAVATLEGWIKHPTPVLPASYKTAILAAVGKQPPGADVILE